ncbi:hypothetical protein UVI_02052470 [Ustilaginoidea virens]|uniref:Autophagy-related protein 33 n=1 Tax=Ustilaginoidea virens TaxID=1159556 RepID=A0A1B5L5I6_USTVR|nr:hypothetical protein UVI_02052470 [Ustilaginoidea virens]
MVCAGARAVSALKFVGTISLGLLTVRDEAAFTFPRFPCHLLASASQAVAALTANLRAPLLTLTSLSSVPLFLAFILSPRRSRHPYLFYTSVLAVLSTAVPRLLPKAVPRPTAAHEAKKPSPAARAKMEASYEVLGDVHSEAASEEEVEDVNGEDVRIQVESLTRGYLARTGLAALGFAMAIVGLWGDGSPAVAAAVVYVS